MKMSVVGVRLRREASVEVTLLDSDCGARQLLVGTAAVERRRVHARAARFQASRAFSLSLTSFSFGLADVPNRRRPDRTAHARAHCSSFPLVLTVFNAPPQAMS
jgi:hypothetical protein